MQKLEPSSSSIVPLTAFTGALLQVWVTFQQKWIFLNKVLHEMKIQFPSPELVGKWVWQDGPVLLNSRALGQSRGAALTLAFSVTTEHPFRGHGCAVSDPDADLCS